MVSELDLQTGLEDLADKAGQQAPRRSDRRPPLELE
jgi:hypothetical protein